MATMQTRESGMRESPMQRAHFPVHMVRCRQGPVLSESELRVLAAPREPVNLREPGAGAKVGEGVEPTVAGTD